MYTKNRFLFFCCGSQEGIIISGMGVTTTQGKVTTDTVMVVQAIGMVAGAASSQ